MWSFTRWRAADHQSICPSWSSGCAKLHLSILSTHIKYTSHVMSVRPPPKTSKTSSGNHNPRIRICRSHVRLRARVLRWCSGDGSLTAKAYEPIKGRPDFVMYRRCTTRIPRNPIRSMDNPFRGIHKPSIIVVLLELSKFKIQASVYQTPCYQGFRR